MEPEPKAEPGVGDAEPGQPVVGRKHHLNKTRKTPADTVTLISGMK
jgi:hypothetical protein